MKRASALVFAIWMIAILSMMVLSFAYEARQQGGINIYVQRRNRVTHVIDAGRILAEIVLVGFPDVPDWSPEQDDEKMLEDDAWFREKQELKSCSRCTIGPVCLDPDNPEDAIVTVEIQTMNSGEKGIININELYQGSSDSKYNERWWMIFDSHGIPEDLDTPTEGRIKLWNVLIASWNDWRDADDKPTSIDGVECGAENVWYDKLEKSYKGIDEDMRNELARRPRQGPIPDIRELEYVRGFRDYPQVLTGGVINPWEDEKNQIRVRGIMDLLTTEGSTKIDVNSCSSVDALITVPGIYERPEREDCVAEARDIAEAILQALGTMPTDRDAYSSHSQWPFKDWNDMLQRIGDLHNPKVRPEDIGTEAQQYLSFSSGKESVFKLKITGESAGMSRSAEAECYVKDKKVRYVKWSED